ncbi:MAG: Nitrate reductase gamma subunit, partial [Pelotomaculum thermopropionicum]
MQLLFFLYFSLFTFLAVSVYKARRLAGMPLHGRWELYPVPREPAERARYGGSYYEDPEWWKKPRKISRAGEIKETLKEMLFIRRLFVNQRRHWWFSYALHAGIYWLVLWTLFLFVGAVMELSGQAIITGGSGNFWTGLIYSGTLISG